jgi:hypothetical protein
VIYNPPKEPHVVRIHTYDGPSSFPIKAVTYRLPKQPTMCFLPHDFPQLTNTIFETIGWATTDTTEEGFVLMDALPKVLRRLVLEYLSVPIYHALCSSLCTMELSKAFLHDERYCMDQDCPTYQTIEQIENSCLGCGHIRRKYEECQNALVALWNRCLD